MAYKVTKTEVSNMTTKKLVFAYEDCITIGVHECMNRTGETKTTGTSRILLQAELLKRLEGLK